MGLSDILVWQKLWIRHYQLAVFLIVWSAPLTGLCWRKPSLDLDVLDNYGPVFNLSFFGKVIGNIVVNQLDQHSSSHGLHPIFQSAYRKFQSIETALPKVHDDLLRAIDNHDSAILSWILSAAFDTGDRSALLNRLETRFGVEGVALDWFRSHFHGRTQRVMSNDVTSETKDLLYGVFLHCIVRLSITFYRN